MRRGPGDEAVTVREGGGAPAAERDTADLPRGATLGRYVVIDRIGAGGMGVVYAAYDPELDRKIAVKLLKPGEGGTGANRHLRARLVREAQAMARLQHPNVIAVHDVGTFGDQVFIAMEFVDGVTLTDWLAERDRSWREIVDVLVRAGRGLAVAHDAGLVHRDFKPDNVLVGHDGRVRVTDFGVARGLGDDEDAAPAGDGGGIDGGADPLSTPLTRTGALLGTPAYMAPEQHLARPTDARTDQFSFCVTLYEALYGERPFSGATPTELAARVIEGRFAPEPKDRDVPSWLRRIAVRGLAPEPDERHVSMQELLGQLGRDPAVARRRWIAAAAVVAGVLAVVAFAETRRAGDELCAGGDDEVARVWGRSQRQAVAAAFGANGADDAFARVARAVDDYGSAWTAMYTEACTATRERGVQSDELLDLRMQCLQRRLDEVDALVRVLRAADASIVDNALNAAQSLTPLDGCANAEALLARVPPPADPDTRAQVDRIRAGLTDVKALSDAGKFAEAEKMLGPLLEQVEQIDYAPIHAEALFRKGDVTLGLEHDVESRGDFEDAVYWAERARDDELAARACNELAYVVGYKVADADGGLVWARRADAKIRRLGGNDELEAGRLQRLGIIYQEKGDYQNALTVSERALELRLRTDGAESSAAAAAMMNIAGVRHALGDYDEAIELYERALAIKERVFGPDHVEIIGPANNLGTVYNKVGRSDEALALYRRVRDIAEATNGPESAGVALGLTNIGGVHMRRGQYADAERALLQAVDIYVAVRGPNHPDVAAAVSTLAIVYAMQGELERAEQQFRRVVDIRTAIYGEDHPETAYAINNLGTVLADREQYDEALVYLDRALELKRKHLGAEHPGLATTYEAIAKVRGERRDFAGAEDYYRRALAIREKAFGADHERVAPALVGLGRLLLDRGVPRRAIEPLERALRLRTASSDVPPADLAETKFALARALWGNRGARERARTLAGEARQGYADAGKGSEDELAEVDAWLLAR